MAINGPTVCVYRRGGADGIFYARVNDAVPISLKTRDETEATNWKQDKLTELRRRALGIAHHYDKPLDPLTWEAAWTAYSALSDFKKKSPATRNVEKLCFDMFGNWCIAKHVPTIEAVTPQLIKEYRRDLQKREKKGGGNLDALTINGYIINAGTAWKYLSAEELFNGINPFRSIEKLKVDRKEPKARPWGEVQIVVAQAKKHGCDIALVFILGMYFGIRKLEILRARWEDLDWAAGTITFHKTKPRPMEYTVLLYPEAIEALLPYRKDEGYIVKPENGYWPEGMRYRWDYRKQWSTVFNHLNKARKTLGQPVVAAFSTHQLRHTLITHLRGQGWSLDDIAAFVCQEETTVTEKYGEDGQALRRQSLKLTLKKKAG